MENPRTTSARPRPRATSSLAPIKPGSALPPVCQGNRIPLGQISVNAMSNFVNRSEIYQPHKIGGLQSPKRAKVLSGPSKLQDFNVRSSSLPLPFENQKDSTFYVDVMAILKSYKRHLDTSGADNLENISPPSKFQRLDEDHLDESSSDLSCNNEDLLDESSSDLSDEETEEDSPMPLERSSHRCIGDFPGSDILSTVEDYSREIVVHMRKIERNFMAKPKYMTKQPYLSFSMRSILVEWMLEVGQEHDFHTETIFLAVNYLDRFLSVMVVSKRKIQLVGTTCMFIASKYEEILPLDLSYFCHLTDDTYSEKEVLKMEQLILKTLDFKCSSPTALFFAKHFLKLAGSPDNCPESSLAQYLAELSLLDLETYIDFLPSEIGAACVTLSRHYLDMAAWDAVGMVEKTGYQIKDFKGCIDCLHNTFANAPNYPQQIVREKYKSSEHHQVAFLMPVPLPFN